MEFLIVIAILVALGNSGLMLVQTLESYERHLERSRGVGAALMATLISLVGVIPWQLGALARGETSALPWPVWHEQFVRHGLADASFALSVNLLFLMWAFLLPGHLYAGSVAKKAGRHPRWPYVMNVIFGLLVCTPSNPIYGMLGALR